MVVWRRLIPRRPSLTPGDRRRTGCGYGIAPGASGLPPMVFLPSVRGADDRVSVARMGYRWSCVQRRSVGGNSGSPV